MANETLLAAAETTGRGTSEAQKLLYGLYLNFTPCLLLLPDLNML